MRFNRIPVILAVGWFASACFDVSPSDPAKETVAAVSGLVTQVGGTGVSEPTIYVQLTTQPSGGTAQYITESSVVGDSNGNFLFIFILGGFVPQTAVANLSVRPPIGSGLLQFDTLGVPVKLVQGRLVTDTTFVAIVLKPRQ